MIHERAIVSSRAKIGKDVKIGPYSIVEADVEIGDRAEIGPHVVIKGPTTIGAETKILQFCSIGEAPQHTAYKGEPTRLEIGARNVIREFCTLNRGSTDGDGVTRIGDDNFIMAYVHIAHDCRVGNRTVFANCASLAGHVLIEDHVILGGFTLIHQYCRVGAHCMTGINTVSFKDIPPYVLAAGNTAVPHGINLRGLKRRKFKPETIEAIRRAYKMVYRSGLKLEEAIVQIKEMTDIPEIAHFVQFLESSERSIIR